MISMTKLSPVLWLIYFILVVLIIALVKVLSYWSFIYIMLYFLFKNMIQKSKQRWHCSRRRSSCKWQQTIIICFVCYIYPLIWLPCHIFLINVYYYINCFIEQNLYWFFCYHSKEGMLYIYIFDKKVVYTIWLLLFTQTT